MRYRFADFDLDLDLGSLMGPDGEVRLRPQALRLLEVLVLAAPKVLSRQELVDRAWAGDFISDTVIRQTLSELRLALGDPAARPRIIETVHRRGYRLIAPVEGLATPSEKQPTGGDADGEPRQRRPPRHQPARRAALVALVVALTIGGLALRQGAPKADPANKALHLSLLEIENLTGAPESRWLAGALDELLRVELAHSGAFRLVDERSAPAGPSAGIAVRGSYIAHRTTPAGTVHAGGLPNDALQVQIEVRIHETRELLGWARETGDADDLPALVRRLARSVQAIAETADETLSGHLVSDTALLAQRDIASSTESLRLFHEALATAGRTDTPWARVLLERAVTIDPDNPLHFDALAMVYRDLGLDGPAASSAERATRLAAVLPEAQRLSVAARAAEIHGRWWQAADQLWELHLRFPNELDYSRRLAAALWQLGRFGEALQARRRAGELSPNGREDPRLDLLESRILTSKNQLTEAEHIVHRLGTHEALQRSPNLASQRLEKLFRIHLRSGQVEDAERVVDRLEEMLGASADGGVPPDHRRRATAVRHRGLLLERQGRLVESQAAYRAALDIFRALGDRAGEAATLNRLAFLLKRSGALGATAPLLRRAAELNRSAGRPRGLVVSLSLLADVYAQLGDLEEAWRALDEAQVLSQAMDDPRRAALCLRSLARVLIAEGEFEDARRRYLEAHALSQGIADLSGTSQAAFGLGALAHRDGRFEVARIYFLEAAKGYGELRYLPDLQASEVRLAKIARAQREPSTSRKL